MSGIDRYKIREYNNTDPRYNFTIGDSSKYNATIYPLHLEKKCKDSEEFDDFFRKSYPPIARCWGQGYENCEQIKGPHGKNCQCSKCTIEIYGDPGSTVSWKTRQEFNPKNLHPNSFYDRTRISKITYPDLMVDRSPDVCATIKRTHDKNDYDNTDIRDGDMIEHCGDIASNGIKWSSNAAVNCCGTVLTACPFCPSFVDAKMAAMLYILCVIICVCLPCICSACKMFK